MKALTFLQKSLIALIIAIFSIGTPPSSAQITSSGTTSLGIYGSVPVSYRSATRYVRGSIIIPRTIHR